MFFAFLKRQSIEIYPKGSSSPVTVNLPTNLLFNLEVKDQRSLTDFLSGFLKSINLPADEGVLFLSEEVSFCQSFPMIESDQTSEQIAAFLALVPFGKSVFVSKEFVLGENKITCATNRSLCISLVYGFAEAGLKITMVLPSFIVGVNGQTVIGKEALDRVAKTLGSEKPYSMLTNIFEGEKKGWWRQ